MKLSPQYVAAFIDCDGCISITRLKNGGKNGNYGYALRVIFYSQNLPAIQDLQETLGGSIHLSETTYRLQLASKEGMACLQTVRPYLRIKVPQAALAIQLCEHMALHQVRRGGISRGVVHRTPEHIVDYRHSLFVEMKRLNQQDSRAFWASRKNAGKSADIKATYGKRKAKAMYAELTAEKSHAEGITKQVQ